MNTAPHPSWQLSYLLRSYKLVIPELSQLGPESEIAVNKEGLTTLLVKVLKRKSWGDKKIKLINTLFALFTFLRQGLMQLWPAWNSAHTSGWYISFELMEIFLPLFPEC